MTGLFAFGGFPLHFNVQNKNEKYPNYYKGGKVA